jgi:hypothetical protein
MSRRLAPAREPVYRSGSIACFRSLARDDTQFGEDGQGDNLCLASGMKINKNFSYLEFAAIFSWSTRQSFISSSAWAN